MDQSSMYRVSHFVANLSWVDLDLGFSTSCLGSTQYWPTSQGRSPNLSQPNPVREHMRHLVLKMHRSLLMILSVHRSLALCVGPSVCAARTWCASTCRAPACTWTPTSSPASNASAPPSGGMPRSKKLLPILT